MNLNESKEGHMEGFGGRNGKVEIIGSQYNLKKNPKNIILNFKIKLNEVKLFNE